MSALNADKLCFRSNKIFDLQLLNFNFKLIKKYEIVLNEYQLIKNS